MDDTPHQRSDTAAGVSRSAEHAQAANRPDPFPPEGTDEKILKPGQGDTSLSEDTRLKATKAALDRETPIPDNHIPHKESFDL